MIKSVLGVGKNKEDVRLCIEEAVREFISPQLIFFFSGEENFSEYARLIHKRFPDALSIGCSAYRTWNRYGTENDVLSVMAIEEGIRCAGGFIPKKDGSVHVCEETVRTCLDQVQETENTICVEFMLPSVSGGEHALKVLGNVLKAEGIPVIGGTAANLSGQTGEAETAYVALNGEVYDEGCVFAVIHNTDGAISLYRENIYEPLTGREFEVTGADNETRTILSLDNEPALDVYAGELGVPGERADQFYFHYPMGRCIDGDTYVTAIRSADADGHMKFHAGVQEGDKMMVMREGDYEAITRRTIDEVLAGKKEPALVLMFHCVARTVLFEENCYIDEYQTLLAEAFPNLIGFACLGEQYGAEHFNHTMQLAVFE